MYLATELNMSPRKIDPKPCACGCGGMAKTGEYMPGHDQKLRSAIEREVGGLANLRSIVEQHIGHTISSTGKREHITHPVPRTVDMSSVDMDSKIKWKVTENPKKPESLAWGRFEKYYGAKTVQDYIDHGGVKPDLKYDWERGFLEVITGV